MATASGALVGVARGAGSGSDIQLAPESATLFLEQTQTHALTATVSQGGDPVSGTTVRFRITDGRNQGTTGTDTTDETGEASFSYTGSTEGTDYIVAEYTDADGVTHRSSVVTVSWEANVAPSFDTFDLTSEGNVVTLSASFTDPNRGQTHTAFVDWGDDTVESAPVEQDVTGGSVDTTHQYDEDGTYGVSLTVVDEDGAGDVGTGTVTVSTGVDDAVVFTQDGRLRALARDGTPVTDLQRGNVVALGSTTNDLDGDGISETPFLRSNEEIGLVDGPAIDITAQPAKTSKTGLAHAPGGVLYVAATGNGDEIYLTAPGEQPQRVANPENGVDIVAGLGDIDGDGSIELVFAGGSQAIRYVQRGDSVTQTFPKAYGGAGSNNNVGVGSPAEFGANGTASVPVVNGSNQLLLVGPEGIRERLITGNDSEQVAKSPIPLPISTATGNSRSSTPRTTTHQQN